MLHGRVVLSGEGLSIGKSLSRPLVPIRFTLNAAAEAAEARQWDRAKTLLGEANRDVQRLETMSANTQMESDLTPIANEVERLSKQAQASKQPDARQIREVANRTRTLGGDGQG